ncbi:universal stress protein [Streptomyces sp. AM8-1-1]|uniref:universal stress protein n=1 Tax=Streptomyces sp. AM8-1-1 TaxID=3075825 RepID=UPI0028C4404D|nr:universal stress protein [Streptomyces sp. AM8-1-1]WNO70288.1 universal stress protein [Streptomyces sp. AM8-1-1]
MTRNVAVGLNGTKESFAAAEWAAGEALLRDVPLHIIYAQDGPPALDRPALTPQMRREWAETLLQDAAAGLRQRHPRLEITTGQLDGAPPEVALRETDADVLVLGSRGLGTVTGFLLGSVGLATVGAAERPVVLVRAVQHRAREVSGTAEGPSPEVVVGVDLRQDSAEVITFAFDAASRRGTTLRVVHCWTLPVVYTQFAGAGANAEVAQRLTDMLVPWRHKYPSVNVIEQSVFGGPAQQLVQASADADLVVIGRHIHHGTMTAHIGPVTHAVLHHATAPVAVIPHG